MKLYRGDNIFNKTEPGRYRCDGIRSKSFGLGTPAYIEPLGLLENIRKHINPVSKQDREIFTTTEFISFSSSRERALFWLASKNSFDITLCMENYKETRYLFILDIDDRLLQPIDAHQSMFLYQFACNPVLKEANSESIAEQALFGAVENGHHFRSCPICNSAKTGHSFVLIDAAKYLHNYKTEKDTGGAIVNAQDDQEWLVLPTDNLNGFTGTTIPRADFWCVEHYAVQNEIRPQGIHEISGIEYDENGSQI